MGGFRLKPEEFPDLPPEEATRLVGDLFTRPKPEDAFTSSEAERDGVEPEQRTANREQRIFGKAPAQYAFWRRIAAGVSEFPPDAVLILFSLPIQPE
jgi:hypothetical protein